MSEDGRISEFGEALREAFSRFKLEEGVIRAERDRDVEAGKAPTGLDVESMLERPTRRFLIDPMLRALDWDPDDPRQVAEEARSWAENGDRLYFDYLGINHRRAPTLLVEAKGADAGGVRPPRAPDVTSQRMAPLISEALATLKAGTRPSALVAEWAEWLDDLRIYVQSLGPIERGSLRRVVITSGRWLIIFGDPAGGFINDGAPEPEQIHCYTSPDEMVERHAEIYRLLARRRLTDTLPVTLTLAEALAILEPSRLASAYRGVVVATRMSGGRRGEYPTRAVYPAMIFISGDRAFAVVDYNAAPSEEPRRAEELSTFLTQFALSSDAFERRVLTMFGRTDLAASPLGQYPTNIREPEVREVFAAAPGSTAALEARTTVRPQLVRQTGERDAEHEYLVITGQAWFYKAPQPFGAPCEFHDFPKARARGVAGPSGLFERVEIAFTISSDAQHCEHHDLRGMRSDRCQLSRIESHLCCRVCAFHDICWGADDLQRLPCAT